FRFSPPALWTGEMSRNETEGEAESCHSARTQAQWIIVVSPSDLAALGHLPHSVREGKKPSAFRLLASGIWHPASGIWHLLAGG
ncbi:MAG: hypothetical protein ABFR53_08925, partial [Actinomycetota bacterium]